MLDYSFHVCVFVLGNWVVFERELFEILQLCKLTGLKVLYIDFVVGQVQFLQFRQFGYIFHYRNEVIFKVYFIETAE